METTSITKLHPQGQTHMFEIVERGSRIVGVQPLDDENLTENLAACYNFNMEMEEKKANAPLTLPLT